MTVHFARCWSCTAGSHFDTPREHPWWDEDDIRHAHLTGRGLPTGLCACEVCGNPPTAEEAAGLAAALERLVSRLPEATP